MKKIIATGAIIILDDVADMHRCILPATVTSHSLRTLRLKKLRLKITKR
jgi:hypothetical protein